MNAKEELEVVHDALSGLPPGALLALICASRRYEAAGRPYGDTVADLSRWLDDHPSQPPATDLAAR
jgi:hypothetical protein